MYILHIIPKEKFTLPFIKFINANFDYKEHFFLVDGVEYQLNYSEENIIDSTNIPKNRIKEMMVESDKIILHSIPSTSIVLMMLSKFQLLKKTFWVIWGSDLYYHIYKNKGIKSGTRELIRKAFIKNVGGIITQVQGDYELAKKWYGAKGKYYYSFLYPSNLYHPILIDDTFPYQQKLVILLGNSADPRNEHIEILGKLKQYKDMDIEIICPLSYGSEEYSNLVIREGIHIFGNRFKPLTHFMQFEQYLQTLSKVDVAIFNHRRQQALGNITTLIGLGKKVYIRNDITTWQFCNEHQLKVSDACGNFEDIFETMSEKDRNQNIKNIKEQFSEKKLKADWNQIFTACTFLNE